MGRDLWGDNDVDVWELNFADAQDSNFPQVERAGQTTWWRRK